MKSLICTQNSNYEVKSTYNPDVCILTGGKLEMPLYIKTPNLDDYNKVPPYLPTKIETPFFSFMGQSAPLMFTIKDIPENGSKAGQIFSTSPIEDITILNQKGWNITDRFQDEIGYDKLKSNDEYVRD